MNCRTIIASLALAAGAFTFAAAQATRPADAEHLARMAKDWGMTPEQFAQAAKDHGMTPQQYDPWNRQQLGDPVVVDGGLAVGIHRDAAGRVRAVKVNTREHSIEFNREVDEKRPGMRYMGTDVTAKGQFASATDLDGDGRIDQIILRESGQKPEGVILVRLDDRFERAAEALGDGRYKLAGDGRTVRFDRSARQWIETR